MYSNFPTSLLVRGELPEEAIQGLFSSLGFQDWQNAYLLVKKLGNSTDITTEKFATFLPKFLLALTNCPDPDLALVNFERLVINGDSVGSLSIIESNPRVLEILLTIFSGSQFLTEIMLRDPMNLFILIDHDKLGRQKSYDEMYAELYEAVDGFSGEPFMNALRRAQKKELLRIGAGDLLGVLDLPTVTQQLSILADAVTQHCLVKAAEQCGNRLGDFVVMGMGKLGGNELNYSSDIDLLFICRTDEASSLKMSQILIDLLTRMTAEGFLYRVDMRLRPWGRDGSLVTSIDGYAKYVREYAKVWERQALIKTRPIAGDHELGNEFIARIEPIIYAEDPAVVKKNVFGMKQRTEEILRERGKEWGQVKLGAGSIRDVEFVIQYLQLLHGNNNPKLRKRSSLQTLRRLHRYHLLSTQESRILTDGYVFLRTVEHFLQMMHYRQTYALPTEPHSIYLLSRRLGFESTEAFIERYEQHSLAIRAVYNKFLAEPEEQSTPPTTADVIDPIVEEHLSRMDAEYSKCFDIAEIKQHAEFAERLSDKDLCFLDPVQIDTNHWRVSIIAFDYLGELSLICGLMFLHGLNILSGDIFTYGGEKGLTSTNYKPMLTPRSGTKKAKIVDVFLVTSKNEPDWQAYDADLEHLLGLLNENKLRDARSELAIRIGKYFEEMPFDEKPLLPIEMTFDNQQSRQYTVIKINTADTIGFLYEFTNALSLSHIYINRMIISTDQSQVNDLLFVSDENGSKIEDEEKLRELRTAAVLIKHFTHLLPRSPNPATALLHFREFLAKLFSQAGWIEELNSLENPQVIDNLARLLGVSDFLWDDFIRMQYQNLFPVIKETDSLSLSKTADNYRDELAEILSTKHNGAQKPDDSAAWKTALNEYKDREMFRIDMRHILGLTKEFWDFSEELTNLTDVIVNTAFHLTSEDLRYVHGTPREEDGSAAQMTVMALGKCGGRELGFASDIELMFVYSGEGWTDGPEPVMNSVFFEKVVQYFLSAIKAKQEGIFQVDLRLRPYGNAGSMAVALDSYAKYYSPRGPAWPYERQALVKMRCIAGDLPLGEQVCQLRDEFVYNGTPFDVIAMRAMRQKQVRHLVAAGKFNAKYSPGGLVDIEYLVQGLQINLGASDPALRMTNIREVMLALYTKGLVTNEDYSKLHKAHTFLRWLIDSMRVVRGNSKDVTVPTYATEEFMFLARRLKFGNDIEKLQETINQVQSDVVEMNRRLLP